MNSTDIEYLSRGEFHNCIWLDSSLHNHLQTSKSLRYLKYFLASRANNYPLYQKSVTEIFEYEYSVILISYAWIIQFVEYLCMIVSC